MRLFCFPETMTNIFIPGPIQQPRIVTLAELQTKLVPMCKGDKWALSAITDLWNKSTPVPQAPGQLERRILFPLQFQAWYADFAQRLGLGPNTVTSPTGLFTGYRNTVSTDRRRVH